MIQLDSHSTRSANVSISFRRLGCGLERLGMMAGFPRKVGVSIDGFNQRILVFYAQSAEVLRDHAIKAA